MKNFLLTTILFGLATLPAVGRSGDLSFSGLGSNDQTTNCPNDQMTDFEAVQNLIVSERLYRVSHRNEIKLVIKKMFIFILEDFLMIFYFF